jgi:hypothetical protein
MRATNVDDKWPELTRAWNDFLPPRVRPRCGEAARKVWKHGSKTRAILETAAMIREMGWNDFRGCYCTSIDDLKQLGWVKDTDARFLARNIGLADVGKPDFWITRAATHGGFAEPDEMFAYILAHGGDRPASADLYIWAYLSDNREQLPPRRR